MYDKDSIIFTCIVVIILAFIAIINFIFTGCATTTAINDRVGREAISTIAKLEEQISQFDRRLEAVTGGAENIEFDLSRFAEQFTLYVDCMRNIRSELDSYKKLNNEEVNE